MADIKADCMTVRLGKTAKTTERVLEFVMAPELEAALAECKAIKPLSIYLSHNKRGQSYMGKAKLHGLLLDRAQIAQSPHVSFKMVGPF